jgi:Flp pilus assembly protein TadD
MDLPDKKISLQAAGAGALIVLAGLVVYGRSLGAPFVFDAAPIVTRYPSIRHLWPLWGALRPPHDGSTVEGRPIVNLSLALSYAASGVRPWAYHAMNLAIHLLAGLALFGILRRTLQRGAGAAGAGRAVLLAGMAALLWTVHPLQTEAVTYIIQRAESLMGLFYLATLYGFVRATEPGAPFRRWAWLAVICCLLGMATKEVMVSAPLIVLLYDRAFVAGSFREAWRRRRGLHLALASTWILLGWLAIGTGGRSGTAGLGAHLPWSDYLLTQAYATVRYLRLALWPHPLVFDYGAVVATGWATLAPCALVVVALAGATLFSLWRNRPAGFLGACFFAVLAPTALVPVATQTIAEHRMYLPLAAVLAALVLGVGRLAAGRRSLGLAALAAGLALAAVYGALTLRRNAIYGSETALWADTVVHWPGNPRAHTQLGDALYRSGRIPEAAEQFERSLVLQPEGNAAAHYDLGNCLLQEGRLPEAVAHLAEAARLDPGNSDADNNLGNALLREERVEDATQAYQAALRADPGNAKARANLSVACYTAGNLLAQAGKMLEAMARYEEALRLNPDFPEAEDNLGNALLQQGRVAEAVARYRAALRLRPDYPRARANLDNALRRLGAADGR